MIQRRPKKKQSQKEMSEFRFKGMISRARVSDVSWEVIPEEGGTIAKRPAASVFWTLGATRNLNSDYVCMYVCMYVCIEDVAMLLLVIISLYTCVFKSVNTYTCEKLSFYSWNTFSFSEIYNNYK